MTAVPKRAGLEAIAEEIRVHRPCGFESAAALHNRGLQATLEADARRLGEHLDQPTAR